jgi:MYXO-CTERM domain-containing protein
VGDIRGARGCEDFDTGEFRVVETGLVGVYLSTYVPEPGVVEAGAAGLMLLGALARRRTHRDNATR